MIMRDIKAVCSKIEYAMKSSLTDIPTSNIIFSAIDNELILIKFIISLPLNVNVRRLRKTFKFDYRNNLSLCENYKKTALKIVIIVYDIVNTECIIVE